MNGGNSVTLTSEKQASSITVAFPLTQLCKQKHRILMKKSEKRIFMHPIHNYIASGPCARVTQRGYAVPT